MKNLIALTLFCCLALNTIAQSDEARNNSRDELLKILRSRTGGFFNPVSFDVNGDSITFNSPTFNGKLVCLTKPTADEFCLGLGMKLEAADLSAYQSAYMLRDAVELKGQPPYTRIATVIPQSGSCWMADSITCRGVNKILLEAKTKKTSNSQSAPQCSFSGEQKILKMSESTGCSKIPSLCASAVNCYYKDIGWVSTSVLCESDNDKCPVVDKCINKEKMIPNIALSLSSNNNTEALKTTQKNVTGGTK